MPDAAPVNYSRLPGSGLSRRGGSFFAVTRNSCRLWLGDDHLLLVESAGGYSETYRRFYFRDIQAIYRHRTGTWLAGNLAFGLPTGLFLLWALLVKDSVGQMALGIITATIGLFLLVNLLRGPTCLCHLKTAVHLEELPSLRRRRTAEKVLARLTPLIEAAQGTASAETLAAQYTALLAGAAASPAVPGQFARLHDPTVTAYSGRAHQILFGTLLADAAADTLNLLLPGVPAVLLSMITGAILAGAVVVALVKQHQTDLNIRVRVLTWLTGGFVGLGYLSGYFIMMVMTPRQNPEGTQWGYVKALASLRPFETPWWLAVLSITAALAALLGAAGLLLLRRHGRERESAV